MIVAMGDEVVETLNELHIPLAQPIDASREGEVQHLTPTIDALVVPDLDACLNDEESKRRFWQAFRALGPWYDALPPY